MKKIAIAVTLALLVSAPAQAQTVVTVEPATMTAAFMNVFNLPAPDGDGAFQFASPWGFNDLVAFFTGNQLTFAPNTIGDPDPYWYQGGGGPGAPGNKIMEANGYAEVLDGSLAGQALTFSFVVDENTLTDAHEAFAFIRDFAPDFSSVIETKIPIAGPGSYTLSQNLSPDPARPVQWGIQMVGVNVWVTDVEPFGSVKISPDQAVSNDTESFGGVKALYGN